VGELVAQSAGQSNGRTVGQQDNDAGFRERGAAAPRGQPSAGNRVERGPGGREDEAEWAVGQRPDAGKRGRVVGGFGERDREGGLPGPGDGGDAADGSRLRQLRREEEGETS